MNPNSKDIRKLSEATDSSSDLSQDEPRDDRDLAPPHASALAESLRAFGYDLATALADLADNSLFHKCRKVRVFFHWAGESSAIAIADDGDGMDEQELIAAMRVGSRSPTEKRDPLDLGRFGLGLKTASFSQGRRVTVFSRRVGGVRRVRCWDLDHIAKTNEWRLLRSPSVLAEELAEQLAVPTQGTVVVWEKLDRLTTGTSLENDADELAFLRAAENVGKHFSAVFHRMMTGKHPVEMSINGKSITPWDPFLADEVATQQLAVEHLSYHGHSIAVSPFILPHLSKLGAQSHSLASGLRGWNAHQGFYIYRNSRLLVPGCWLGLKGWRQEEHYKLARIRVDLPNALDHDWAIDVTKSRATPPEKLRRELIKIGEITRGVAKRVYSYRGAKLLPAEGVERVFLWERVAKHNQVVYRLNREHPLVKGVARASAEAKLLEALLRFIEETIPVPLITSTDCDQLERMIGPFEGAKESETLLIMRQVFAALIAGGLSRSEALLRLAHIEPLGSFPALLNVLREECTL